MGGHTALLEELAEHDRERAKLAQEMVDSVFSFAEPGFQEFKTSEYITGILEKNGFKITRGVAGIPTAWTATWGTGGPLIALMFLGEFFWRRRALAGEDNATMADAIRLTGEGYKPRVVFTSSIAVFGAPLPYPIPDEFHTTPLTSYGTQKAICELLLNDYSRKGFVDGVGIRLYGAVPPAVANAYIQSLINPRLAPPGAAANFEFYSQGTLFTGAGIEGPVAATIDDANANGGFHAHLDWFIEGAAPSSAYMVTLQLTDAASIGGRGRYVDSDPFHVVFNYGLSAEQYETAFMSRVSLPVPEPSSWALMVAGLVLTTGLARRVRS